MKEKYLKIYTKKGFKEKNFEDRLEKHPHQTFWEVIIANFLLENNFYLKKDKKFLDFYFDINKQYRIHIEATAPESGKDNNYVKDVPSEEGDFEESLSPDKKILLRYTSSIEEKLKQIKKKTFSSDDKIVLAINGYRAEKDWCIPGEPPFILRILFQSGDLYCGEKNELFFDRKYGIEKKIYKCYKPIKNNYFLDIETPISGIIFSKISGYKKFNKNDFLYIQNPLKEDLTKLFSPYMNIYS